MPVRLIMNNRTLTVLEGTEYDQQLHTFNLPYTKIYQLNNRRDCFGIEEERPARLNHPAKMIFCDFNAGKTHGVPVKLTGFACFRLGEGIEKEEKDFAAEVAEQLNK